MLLNYLFNNTKSKMWKGEQKKVKNKNTQLNFKGQMKGMVKNEH